jgi:tetratricopeptide (TPR) repeat protein
MAERAEETETELGVGAEPISPASAMAIGMHKGRRRTATDPDFQAFLRKQSRLIDLQTEHLHEQRQVILARLRLGRWKDRVTLALQALTGLVGLAIAAAVAAMAWQAHEDHGVVVQPFSVPPDLAQRGLTGQVVASRLLGRLADLQAKTVSSRPASSYANNWGDDIKVEIPETGVSIGELNRYLRDWLGSETRITGDVVRTPTGIAVTAQAGASAGATFAGSEADLSGLIQQSAEAIYQQTQPYRYAVYLASEGKTNEALKAYTSLAEDSAAAPKDRAWAYLGWATLLRQRGDARGALAKAAEAISLDKWIEPARFVQTGIYGELGRLEDSLETARAQLPVLESGRAEGISPEIARVQADYIRDSFIGGALFGDAAQAIAALRRMPERMSYEGFGSYSFGWDREETFIGLHDLSDAKRQRLPGSPPDAMIATALDDWATALRLIEEQVEPTRALPTVQAYRAYYLARLGRIAEARSVIAQTPADCTECLIARGQIAALAGERRNADRWFGEAVRQAPLPIVYFPWGQSLLVLGDPDAAIVELKQAHKLGPHYADPLEVWGEALMAKRDYAGAISRFAEADKDAPKWGRNHLRWGEALMLSGHYAEARTQYQIANGLDLSAGDRAALNLLLARTATGPLHG